jgi:hypothetical protein
MSLKSERPGHKACSVIYVELCADRTYRSVSLVRGTASRRGKAKITRVELHLAAVSVTALPERFRSRSIEAYLALVPRSNGMPGPTEGFLSRDFSREVTNYQPLGLGGGLNLTTRSKY